MNAIYVRVITSFTLGGFTYLSEPVRSRAMLSVITSYPRILAERVTRGFHLPIAIYFIFAGPSASFFQ